MTIKLDILAKVDLQRQFALGSIGQTFVVKLF